MSFTNIYFLFKVEVDSRRLCFESCVSAKNSLEFCINGTDFNLFTVEIERILRASTVSQGWDPRELDIFYESTFNSPVHLINNNNEKMKIKQTE